MVSEIPLNIYVLRWYHFSKLNKLISQTDTKTQRYRMTKKSMTEF